MYDISLSYMMYLPVSHSIPLTIILHSAFCKIPLPEVTNKDPKREPRSGKYSSYLSAVSLKAYIRIRTIPFIPFSRQPGSFVVMSADQVPQVPANNIPAAQAVLPAPQQPQPAVAAAVAPNQETLEVNVRVFSIYLFIYFLLLP